jgi:hypothetical protein
VTNHGGWAALVVLNSDGLQRGRAHAVVRLLVRLTLTVLTHLTSVANGR